MDPAKALESVPDMDGNAIFVFKDFARHLEDPAPAGAFASSWPPPSTGWR